MKRISFITIFVASLLVSLSIAAKESTPESLSCQSTTATVNESNLSNEQKLLKYTALLDTLMIRVEKDTNAILCAYQQIFLLYRSTERDHEIKKLYEASDFLKTIVPTNENVNNYAPTILRVVNTYLKLKEIDNASSLINDIQSYFSLSAISDLDMYLFHMKAGQVQIISGKFKDGINSHILALKLIQNSTDISDDDRSKRLVHVNAGIGNAYWELGDYKNAIKHYKKHDTVYNLHNIALAQLELSEWEQALVSAAAASKKAQQEDNTLIWANSNVLIARAKHQLGQTDEAIEIIKEPIAILKEGKHATSTIEALALLAEFHIQLEQWDKAEIVMLEANQLSNSSTTDIMLYEKYFETNFLIEEKKNNYKEALEFYKQMLKVKEDKFELLQQQISQRLMLDYELEIAQETLLRLEQENKLTSIMLQNKESKNQLLISVIVGTSTVLLLLIYVYLRERKSKLKMSHLALTDHLTNCPNRRHSLMHANGMMRRSNSNKHSMIVAILDVDNFKVVNDTYGHDIGDIVLQNLSSIIKGVLRESDVIGRYGGEEFILLLPNADEQEITRIFSRIQIALRNHVCEYKTDQISMPLSVSMGAVIATDMPNNVEEQENSLLLDKIIKQADEKAYEAKEGGKDQLRCVKVSLSN
ncbi:MAG: tetratricopeptide repeat-containing diguanylate cyclase [Pseudoalteromonas sp.]